MITSDNLRVFMGKFETSAELNDQDFTAWITRNDKDVDGGLNFIELVGALQSVSRAPIQTTPEERGSPRTSTE